MPTRVETTRLTCQKHKIVHRPVGRATGTPNMGTNVQQYVWVRLKALGAINSSNCHADGLRGPTGSPKVSSSIETIAMCNSDGRGEVGCWRCKSQQRCDRWPWNLNEHVGADTET